MEALEIASNMACVAVVQMRQCLLHLHGLVGQLQVQEQLVAAPFDGIHIIGPSLAQYTTYLTQSAEQVKVLTKSQPRAQRPRLGAQSGYPMQRMSLLDPPKPRSAPGLRQPFQGARAPGGRGSGPRQPKKPKRH
jgi:hypothetical protein